MFNSVCCYRVKLNCLFWYCLEGLDVAVWSCLLLGLFVCAVWSCVCVDMDELSQQLTEARDAKLKLIVSDGVFSMDGSITPLK